MPAGLKRYYGSGNLHFITFSCYHRLPLLNAADRDLFLSMIEKVRERYVFGIAGYVIMPEHVHVLVSEPARHAFDGGSGGEADVVPPY